MIIFNIWKMEFRQIKILFHNWKSLNRKRFKESWRLLKNKQKLNFQNSFEREIYETAFTVDVGSSATVETC